MALALEHRDFWEVEVGINLDVEHVTHTTREITASEHRDILQVEVDIGLKKEYSDDRISGGWCVYCHGRVIMMWTQQ